MPFYASFGGLFPACRIWHSHGSRTVTDFALRWYSAALSFNWPLSAFPGQSRLDHKRNETRLLTILPGGEDDPIMCAISKISLDDMPVYETLSYMWGDPNHREQIRVGGHMRAVTINLAEALRHLRYESLPRIVWIDALCINQADAEERNHQVQLMKSIYSAASRVLIWLGEARPGTCFTMDGLESLCRGESIDAHTASLANVYFQGLFGQQWSTRTWVVQELAVAKQDPRIGRGHKWLPWSTFVVGCSALRSENGSNRLFTTTNDYARIQKDEPSVASPALLGSSMPDRHLQRFQDLDRLRSDFITKKGLPLRQLLRFTMDLDALDPRDKIYSLFGMLDKSERGYIKSDYRKAAPLVYAETMAFLLQNVGSVQPACFFALSKPDSNELPSWVPNFSQQSKSSHHNPLGFYHRKHNASGSYNRVQNRTFLCRTT